MNPDMQREAADRRLMNERDQFDARYQALFDELSVDEVLDAMYDDAADVLSELLHKQKTVDQVINEWRHLICETELT